MREWGLGFNAILTKTFGFPVSKMTPLLQQEVTNLKQKVNSLGYEVETYEPIMRPYYSKMRPYYNNSLWCNSSRECMVYRVGKESFLMWVVIFSVVLYGCDLWCIYDCMDIYGNGGFLDTGYAWMYWNLRLSW